MKEIWKDLAFIIFTLFAIFLMVSGCILNFSPNSQMLHLFGNDLIIFGILIMIQLNNIRRKTNER